MPTHVENETALLTDARAGSAEAFTTLVRLYDRRIYRLALNITGSREDAEDVLQEAFLKAYAHLGQFQGDSRFYTWLVRIAVNEALMKLRKRRAHPSVSVDEMVASDDGAASQEIADWGDTPEQRYAKVELAEILNRAVEGLNPALRTVFVLREMENLSTEETAEMLNISVPAVKSRLLRARLRLRKRLNPYFKRG